MSSIIDDFIEVKLNNDDDFLKVKETLTRIGISSKTNNVLYQSCHILHKQGKYYIVHFKELFLLDGKQADITENDLGRRNTVSRLLEEWNLVSIVNKNATEQPRTPISQIKIVSYKDKHNWNLVPKYNIGNKK